MKKYFVTLILLLCSIFFMVPVFAVEQAVPIAPSWVADGEYLVFENSIAYEPEVWNKVIDLRKEVEISCTTELAVKIAKFNTEYANDAGINFEVGLLYYRFFINNDYFRIQTGSAKDHFTKAGDLSEHGDNQKIAYMWAFRSSLLYQRDSEKILPKFLDYPDYNIREVAVNNDVLKYIKEYGKNVLASPLLLFDENNFDTDGVYPEMINNRVMLPIRTIAEAIGSTVEWNGETNEITIVRAADTLKLTVGNRFAYKNGKAITLDVAPYIKDGHTFLPVRFVSEQLGQKVTWAAKPQIVSITENKDTYENSNLEMWVKAMGGYLTEYPKNRSPFSKTRNVNFFTGYAVREKANVVSVRNMLMSGWSVTNREELLYQIEALTEDGHNSEFLYDVAFINSLTTKEYEMLMEYADGLDEYMFPFTKELGNKWGKRGIMAWDLFRVSNLAQWGYIAGYLTYDEAVEAVKPAAKKLQENFNTWEEAYDNYVDGHIWWSRTDVRGLDYEEWGRRAECKEMMQNYKDVFDDNLFKERIN